MACTRMGDTWRDAPVGASEGFAVEDGGEEGEADGSCGVAGGADATLSPLLFSAACSMAVTASITSSTDASSCHSMSPGDAMWASRGTLPATIPRARSSVGTGPTWSPLLW
jgi:hypothetical protein